MGWTVWKMNNSSPREVLAAPNEINIITVYSFFCSPLTASQSSKSRTQRLCARSRKQERFNLPGLKKSAGLVGYDVVWCTARRITQPLTTYSCFIIVYVLLCYVGARTAWCVYSFDSTRIDAYRYDAIRYVLVVVGTAKTAWKDVYVYHSFGKVVRYVKPIVYFFYRLHFNDHKKRDHQE